MMLSSSKKQVDNNNDKVVDDGNRKKMKSGKVSSTPPPPQAVSSSSSSDDDDDDDDDDDNEVTTTTTTATPVATAATNSHTVTSTTLLTQQQQQQHQHQQQSSSSSSRLFAPYRTLGVVSSGRAFFLLPNQNSAIAMVCLPIGERFHMLQCDHLQPILVSQAVPSHQPQLQRGEGGVQGSSSSSSHITHMISDTTLSIAVVGHGGASLKGSRGSGKSSSLMVTLYARTKPIHTLPLTTTTTTSSTNTPTTNKASKTSSSSLWSMVDMLHLGHAKVAMKGEKKGKSENGVIVAVVVAKALSSTDEDDNEDGVVVVGNDSDDDDSDDENEDMAQYDSVDSILHHGEVVVYVATRLSLREERRIPLTTIPHFRPHVAVHPATYLNKIVVGGTDTNTKQPMLILLNVKSQKVIHVFACLSAAATTTQSSSSSTTKSTQVTITALEQSPAVDTIAVGTSSGLVHLINLRHDQLLFTLTHKPRDLHHPTVTITSLSFRTDGTAMRHGIAPLAVGRSDGTISIWDLTPPEADDDDDDHDDDDLHTNNNTLMGHTLLCEMEQVHAGGIAKIAFLPQEPLLLSIGNTSNAILMHIFDSPDHSARLLRQRKGHTAPPKRIRYLHPGAAGGGGGGILVNAADGTDASACQILSSGGLDRTLRVFSSARSVLDKEFSQGRGLEKQAKKLQLESTAELLLPPLVAMATCETRSRDWGDLVTIHQDHAMAYVWSTRRGAQAGCPVLRQPSWNISAMKSRPPLSAHATSVAISACGNYAMVGTRGGVIYKYNLQSGMARGCYPLNHNNDDDEHAKKNKKNSSMPGNVGRTLKLLEKTMKVSNRAADMDKREGDIQRQAVTDQRLQARLQVASHVGFAVTGIAVDSVNKVLLSVGTDAKLILWHFATHAPHQKSPFVLPAPATQLCHVRDSDLAAIALDGGGDYTAVLFDCTSQAIVRRFGFAATGPITDLGFSPDGRSLFISSLDSTLRVWDVPTNSCVDWMKFDSPVTSLCLSPTGEFLATTHANKLGISLWSDKSFYQTTHVNGISPTEPTLMDDPVPIAEINDHSGENEEEEDERDDVQRFLSSSSSNVSSLTVTNNKMEVDNQVPAKAKEPGLITMSGFPPAHWKNLFHLELVKERNKPKEAPKKPPTAPFFLQWRAGESILGDAPPNTDVLKLADANNNGKLQPKGPGTKATNGGDDGDDDKEWNAVWSDDDDENDDDDDKNKVAETFKDKKKESDVKQVKATTPSSVVDRKRVAELSAVATANDNSNSNKQVEPKRRKVKHARSHLAALLEECNRNRNNNNHDTTQQEQQQQKEESLSSSPSRWFQPVTDHLATLGPSAIDVSLSTLCNGNHDLEDGLPLLNLATMWLCEACQSRERFEAVNAYLHRFLQLHAKVIAGIMEEVEEGGGKGKDDHNNNTSDNNDQELQQQVQRRQLLDSIAKLRQVQRAASDTLRIKMQQALCMLRHFSRMV